MAIALLSPQDCLRDPIPSRGALLSTPPRTKIHRNSDPSPPSYKSNSRHSRIRRKQIPNSSPQLTDASLSPQSASKSLMMGGVVKILKRCEKIPNEKNQVPIEIFSADSNKVSVNRSVDGFYAGSGFFTSPPPSSLPMPAFIKKTSNLEATTGLCRLLNLSL